METIKKEILYLL